MPNYPRCLKYFSSEQGIKFHLSQPCCACYDNNYAFELEVPHLCTSSPVEDMDLVDISFPMHSLSPVPLDWDSDLPHEPPAALP